MSRVALEWQLRGCLGREWEWHVQAGKAWDAPGWLPARVPGSVLDDLERAGEIAPLRLERQSREAEWVPQRAWVYRTRLAAPAGSGRATLRFEGVDHEATVLLDAVELARHEGPFVPFDVDLGDRLADGAEHLLAVVVHPAPPGEPQVGDTARVRVHKSRMTYGWDFCPRQVHQGIWRPVTLHPGEPARVPTPLVTLSPDLREGRVVEPGRLRLLDAGTVVAEGRDELRVAGPALWWPNGEGEQHRYTLEVEGAERPVEIGFRRIELAPNEGAPVDARPYTVVVNGRRLYARGWNWVPLDAQHGVPRPEKLAHLLGLARRAHVNLLRVWGGGLIESTAFYELCDRLGLLVWQEFAQSSSGMGSVPAADDEFVALMEREARAIVPLRRRHPSLALWCGGNELARREPGREDDVPLDESHPVLAALRRVVRELDPERAWLPTSPSGPRFLNRLDLIRADPDGQHDVHGPWEHQGLRRQYELYDAATCLLHSELGVEGMTNRRALEALVGPEHRRPADRTNPVYEHLGAWWNNAPLVRACFGGRIDDLDTLRRASQWLQYDGLRYAVEASLRRRWRSSGVLPWQLNESFPNAWCTAAVDWHGQPKPAYWGVARAYRPDAVSASFATCAWGGQREVRARIHGDVRGRLVGLDGSIAAESAGEVAAPLGAIGGDVFVLDLEGRNRYVLTTTPDLAPLLDLPPARLELERRPGALRLACAGGVAALGVVLEDARPLESPGWPLLSDNVLDLLPGEEREIGLDGPAEELRVEGWNVEARVA